MESSLNISKRKQPLDFAYEKCAICQKSKKDKEVRDASTKGLASFTEAFHTRITYKCEQYTDLLNGPIDLDNNSSKLKWHKDCFAGFTSSLHLTRLKKRFEKSNAPSCQVPSIADPINEAARLVSRRSGVQQMEWDKCMFCQESDNLNQVQTLETSAKIVDGSKCDSLLQYRIAGISDLVAAEGKYHLKCYSKFLKDKSKFEKCEDDAHSLTSFGIHQSCFNSVIKELDCGLKQGKIYAMKTVWSWYCELVAITQSAETACQNENNSNAMRHFRCKIKEHFGQRIEFIAQERKRDSLLIFPNIPKESIISELRENVSELEEKDTENKLLKAFTGTVDTDFLRSMHHVSSKLKSDIKGVQSHNRYDGIDKDSVEDSVPPDLYMFLSMIIGGNEQEEQRDKIFSIAQDIVYVSSGGRTLTPKHVGLASTIHHATRNKSLVQLVHAAGHCCSYETVEKIDTSIAKQEVERWKENANLVIPPNLTPGKFTQFAGDNINIKVETLDGKGMLMQLNAQHSSMVLLKVETLEENMNAVKLSEKKGVSDHPFPKISTRSFHRVIEVINGLHLYSLW